MHEATKKSGKRVVQGAYASTSLTPLELLDKEFYCNDFDKSITLRQYFIMMLLKVFHEQEMFSGKRPFGNSGWVYDLASDLAEAGLVNVTRDEYGYVEDIPDDFDDLIAACINALDNREDRNHVPRDKMLELLAELERQYGPIPKEIQAEVDSLPIPE
jgi:hypothetical protein